MNAVLRFTYSVLLVVTFLFLVVAFTPSYSGEISIVDNDTLFFDGEVLSGDGEAFLKILEDNPQISYLVINSNGGTVSDGMLIATAVHKSQLVTFVPRDGSCYSMCSVIFLSGYKQVLTINQHLGFHPSYIEWSDGTIEVDPQTSAQISWWFGKMGVPLKIVWEMMGTDPENMVTYTGLELNSMGMSIILFE
jgi:hypothetical protein